MKVEIIARETIKPSSPTPKSLKNFKLSLTDQLSAPIYIPMLFFFYLSNDQTTRRVSVSETSQRLKKSLSQTLTLFYPLAGKLKDNINIDCSDYGAVYIEARVVDCSMSCFLERPNGDELPCFVPIDMESTEAVKCGFLTFVQASFFDCGGVVICVSICHKLGDAITVRTFMKCWAAKMAIGSGADAAAVVPLYNAAVLFPPRKLCTSTVHLLALTKEKVLKRRLVFEASKMAALKAAAASESVERPSRAEAVMALIWKCGLNAARSNLGSSRRSSALARVFNIRRRMSPPLSDNSMGNFIGFSAAQKDESEAELQGLVRDLREKTQVSDKRYVEMLQREDALEAVTEYLKEVASLMMRHDVENYVCTSLCNSSLYDIDFGWGKPVWVTVPAANSKNGIVLMDTSKGDGSVEAWVVLSEQDMYLFERDPELLAYASINPSVLEAVDTKSRWIKSSV